MINIHSIILIVFFNVQVTYVFSYDRAWDAPASSDLKDAFIPGLIATGETLLSNGVVMLFNRYISNMPWAFPTAESIHGNFTTPWKWEDTDGFLVNQFGHPIQGAMYFSSGRLNGFGFYESLFFSALGSFTWETFGEAQHASMNDFITSVTSSMAAGEILYRLYLEALASGVPPAIAAIINPMAGFHRLVTGWTPPPGGGAPNTGGNIHRFQTQLGTGYAHTNYSVTDNRQEVFTFRGPYIDAGLQTVYGNPFQQNTRTPYQHFELAASIGMNISNYNDIRIISDGYLLSFSPLNNLTNQMSNGLSMHLDFISLGEFGIYDSTIDLFSNALNWTVKYRHFFTPQTAMETKIHAGFTFFGVSKFHTPEPRYFSPALPEKNELNNFGFGFNAKRFYSLEHNNRYRLDIMMLNYMLWNYPGTSALSNGFAFWHFTDISYSHGISDRTALGLTGSIAREWGSFSGFPDTRKRNRSIKMFVAWNLS